MLFNSYIFVLFFLPVCLIGYFVLNHFNWNIPAQIFLLGMSLWFYAFFNIYFLPVMISSIIFNYFFSKILCYVKKDFLKTVILLISFAFNIGILFYFKYFNFFFEIINTVFQMNFALTNIGLPLGISFFTFQQISYMVDVYKGDAPAYNLIQYGSFVTFFPQLIAGPIVTHNELIPQFEDRTKKV